MNSKKCNCCVCLNNCLVLNKLTKTDENNLTFLSKLIITIPEIEWATEFHICAPCTNLLNIVYTFRETCLKSDFIRRQEVNEIKEITQLDVEISTHDLKQEAIKNEEINDIYSIGNGEDIDDNSSNASGDLKIKLENNKEKRSIRRKRIFNCERCAVKFNSSPDLIKHCVDKHGMDKKDVRPFRCTKCDNRFGNSSNLLQHIKYHEAVRSNVCSYCGKGFITKTDMKIHEKQHLNMREYECMTCMKSFNTHKDLRSHKLVVHTDPELWKYLCEYCNKRFPIKSNYDSHVRRHTGVKNFECHLCDRKFSDKCVLQKHLKSHSNVREFRCNECGKEYKDKRVMRIHMVKAHGIGVGEIKLPTRERKYICHMCPKAYYAKNKLTRHLYTHTGEKPFFCTVCEKKFNDKSYVKQHMKKSHNIEMQNSL